MTIHLNLPKEIELRLIAEVNAGRHASVEEAILEKISKKEDPELLSLAGMDAAALRQDLDDAWNNRTDTVDGRETFDRLAAKSAALRASGL